VNQRIAIKEKFEEEGQAIAEWARQHGYKPRTVYAVIAGKVKCKRGVSHRIAVELGIKKRPQSAA
jgi:gp16 family phage-associated protein